jgi:hypothetical protein
MNNMFEKLSDSPANAVEQQIQNLLVESGYNSNEIQFRQRGDSYHLRYDYWRPIYCESISQFVEEITIDDDDCGTLYLYKFKEPFIA